MAADRFAGKLVKHVLVTGATGFLGRHVLAALAECGATVTAHGCTQAVGGIECLRGDLADPATAAALLQPWRWDAVVNLAGPVTSGNEDLCTGIDVVAAHTRIALHLRRFARGARIVHASSMTVYGMPTETVVTEQHPRRPTHLYGLAKTLAEDVLFADSQLDVWSLRLPGLFSEQRTNGALYHFCRAARAGEPIRITATTPTVWNILHVTDAAEVIVRALAAPSRAGGALNISYNEPIEIVAIANLIAQLAGTGVPVERVAHVSHMPVRLDTTKAEQLLGWTPPRLIDRLAKLYADYAAA